METNELFLEQPMEEMGQQLSPLEKSTTPIPRLGSSCVRPVLGPNRVTGVRNVPLDTGSDRQSPNQ